MKKYKLTLWVIGLGYLIGVFITFIITFMSAYFNETKTVRVYVNRFNEADFEFVFLIIGIVICFYLFRDMFLWIKKRRDERIA